MSSENSLNPETDIDTLSLAMGDFLQGRPPQDILSILINYKIIQENTDAFENFKTLISFFQKQRSKPQYITFDVEDVNAIQLLKFVRGQLILNSHLVIIRANSIPDSPQATYITNPNNSLYDIQQNPPYPSTQLSPFQRKLDEMTRRLAQPDDLLSRRLNNLAPTLFPFVGFNLENGIFKMSIGYKKVNELVKI